MYNYIYNYIYIYINIMYLIIYHSQHQSTTIAKAKAV